MDGSPVASDLLWSHEDLLWSHEDDIISVSHATFRLSANQKKKKSQSRDGARSALCVVLFATRDCLVIVVL